MSSRKRSGCADRTNSRNLGVDTNRNYGGLWGGPGASISESSDIYRGEAPFSEPENQNIRELVSQDQVTTLITNHTFSNLILRPPGVAAQGPPPDEEVSRALGQRMANQNGYTNQKGYELYDTTGTTEDWTYSATAGLGFTFEIGPDEFHPPFEEVVAEWEGTRGFEGKGNREAYYIAMESAADEAMHSVVEGSAPAGSVIRLSKSFTTSSHDPLFLNDDGSQTGDAIVFEDTLDTTMVVPESGQFEFHANPSTRPQNDERTWIRLAEEPSRTETFENSTPTVPGGGASDLPVYYQEFAFTVTEEDDRQGLRVSTQLAEDSPGFFNDYDLFLYRVLDGGARQAMGNAQTASGNETITVENVEPGEYVVRVLNWLAEDPRYTVTFGTYAAGETEHRARSPEAWTLTCEQPDGTVADTQKVFVDRAERVSVGSVCGSGGPGGGGKPGKPDKPDKPDKPGKPTR